MFEGYIIDITPCVVEIEGYQVKVMRLWIYDPVSGSELAVLSATYPQGSGPQVKDHVHWSPTAHKIFYNNDRCWLTMIGNAFDPRDEKRTTR